MDLGATIMALLAGLFVKGAVLFLGARLLWRLYRTEATPAPRRLWLLVPAEDRFDVRVLRASLLLFVLSELSCGIEAWILFSSNPFVAGFHSLTSGIGIGLFGWGFYAVLDRRVLHFGPRGCIGNRVCRGCTIATPGGCNFRPLFLYAATLLALASLAPLFVSTARLNADVTRYILPFPAINAWYDGVVVPFLSQTMGERYQNSGIAYYLPESMLFIEFRVLPMLSLAASSVGIVLLRRGREAAGVKAIAFAAGVLSFVVLEIVLFAATGDVILGSLGHEVAEFWFLLATVEVLRRFYPPRPGALPLAPAEAASA